MVKKFFYKKKIKKIFYNKQYEINEIKRDEKLKFIVGKQIKIYEFNDDFLFEPGSILNKNKKMYKVFTPFRNLIIKKISKTNIYSLPTPKIRKYKINKNINIPPYFNYDYIDIPKSFSHGENTALQKLKKFCRIGIKNYDKLKNIPSINGTSYLSPYLNIGVISPRQCFSVLLKENPSLLKNNNSIFHWLNELIWREFYRHLIIAYPFLCDNIPFIKWTNKIKWNRNKKMFSAWKNGITGYPLVDAGMRQLKKTGWINNRLRMVTASFLVKDLLIDWRKGQKYFIQELLDGDFASNNGGWQWIASTGVNYNPYYRSFNPIIQSKYFDPHGDFIRYWVPELNKVKEQYIHTPHLLALKYKNIIKYPLPIIDYKLTKKRIFNIFNKAKNSKN